MSPKFTQAPAEPKPDTVVPGSSTGTKHDLKHVVRRDVGEATLFDLTGLREALSAAQALLDRAAARAEHVATGGSPDDPPAKWRKARKP
jgi:hypothetical protein